MMMLIIMMTTMVIDASPWGLGGVLVPGDQILGWFTSDLSKWDEERFGLVYDLDIYMVVAVEFFNMGAMENKGLNIFNAKYVLADPLSRRWDPQYRNGWQLPEQLRHLTPTDVPVRDARFYLL